MNRWYKKLQSQAIDTRKRNADYFRRNPGTEARLDPEYSAIWEAFDREAAAIRRDIEHNVDSGDIGKASLSMYDEVVRSLNEMASRNGNDWTDTPSASALVGCEAIFAVAPPFV